MSGDRLHRRGLLKALAAVGGLAVCGSHMPPCFHKHDMKC
jgi:hypothetical protein